MSAAPVGAAGGDREDPWSVLRGTTQARIGLGHAGAALPTRASLELSTALAAAHDAVHAGLDLDDLLPELARVGLGDPIVLRSQARDRGEYLRRPDLGRIPADMETLPTTGWQLGIVLADGLSSTAIERHAVALVEAILAATDGHYSIAPPVVITQARVAAGDWIGERMGLESLLVLIGERPGLSVSDSVGIYLTHHPVPGRNDAERNCISNVHPPEGLGYAEAAATACRLLRGARAIGRSGVTLKDSGPGADSITG